VAAVLGARCTPTAINWGFIYCGLPKGSTQGRGVGNCTVKAVMVIGTRQGDQGQSSVLMFSFCSLFVAFQFIFAMMAKNVATNLSLDR